MHDYNMKVHVMNIYAIRVLMVFDFQYTKYQNRAAFLNNNTVQVSSTDYERSHHLQTQ